MTSALLQHTNPVYLRYLTYYLQWYTSLIGCIFCEKKGNRIIVGRATGIFLSISFNAPFSQTLFLTIQGEVGTAQALKLAPESPDSDYEKFTSQSSLRKSHAYFVVIRRFDLLRCLNVHTRLILSWTYVCLLTIWRFYCCIRRKSRMGSFYSLLSLTKWRKLT